MAAGNGTQPIEQRTKRLRAYCRTVAHHLLVDGGKTATLRLLDDLFPEGPSDAAAWMVWRGDGPLDEAQYHEVCERLADAIPSLSDYERYVITQYYYERLKDPEIADLLSSPNCADLREELGNPELKPENVKRTRWRGIEKLRSCLAED